MKRRERRAFWRELPVLIVVALLIALLIRSFLIQAFYIPSGSMERTLLIGDRVLVNKLVYDFRSPHRGEVVVFNGNGTGFEHAVTENKVAPASNFVVAGLRHVQSFIGVGAPGDNDFIKRVIAVPGDTVACCDVHGRVTVNGVPLDETYINTETDPISGEQVRAPTKNLESLQVPAGRLFVMGDNRDFSGDSRVYGTVPESKVVGRAFVRVWPLDRLGWLSVPSTFARTHGAEAAVPLVDPAAMLGFVGVAPVAAVRAVRRRRERRQLVER